MANRADADTPLTIREATAADEAVLGALFVELNELHAEALPDRFRGVDLAAGREFVRQHMVQLAEAGGTLLVAAHEGRVIGFVEVGVRHAPDLSIMVSRRYAHESALAVTAGFRRRGVGQALMERAHGWARDQGLDHVEVVVYDFNGEAAALYTKLGYAGLSRRLWRSLR